MKHYSKSFYYALLLAGMILGTAWAIRGQFGHEQGAAWAGAIGSLGILVLAKKPEWYPKALKATLAGAIGWGLGGLMSYGMVVGYGRGTDFPNVYYGLAMLLVIGGLYGFVGGGLFGLVLSESEEKKVAWHTLKVEMVVAALVAYFFIVEEWGWLMTPPRSELWAACLGSALGLTWFLVRNGHPAALRVAIYAGLGGGFGFAFGNFLQVLGNVSQIPFNFWNVMEYSLGFFGGAGMAYGTFTADWKPQNSSKSTDKPFWFVMGALLLFIPLVVWDQSFGAERVSKILTPLTTMNADTITQLTQLVAFLSIVGMAYFWFHFFYVQNKSKLLNYNDLKSFLLAHWGLYTFLSLLITGAFLSTYRIEQYLYLVNIVVVGWFISKVKPDFYPTELHSRKPWILLASTLLVLAILAWIATMSHGEVKGAQVRF
ncbi:hypothetical protein [Arundinibacter roseus]|uniref:DUF3464 family protein n=1 Tax=Arundinibacter roseus TaxID=2070510 RepID=A0A4V2X8Z2_9BACT|nr:hypothetical protein [Arundinibacter roseus]TDB61775.1 hypothetical protein EZE20_18685 [Arundinibacter roseus]